MSTTPPPTNSSDDITQEQFDRMLEWLDPDRDQAGAKYELIRKRLVKIFVSRGADVPDELADLTINRVARKLPEIEGSYVGPPGHYFCGVANNIFYEWCRRKQAREKAEALGSPAVSKIDAENDRDHACLEKCVRGLSEAERDLVIAYYRHEKRAKISHRQRLAETLGLRINALRIRAFRIRSSLLKCVEDCRCEGT